MVPSTCSSDARSAQDRVSVLSDYNPQQLNSDVAISCIWVLWMETIKLKLYEWTPDFIQQSCDILRQIQSIKSNGWMFLLVPAHPRYPGQSLESSVKWLCMCV